MKLCIIIFKPFNLFSHWHSSKINSYNYTGIGTRVVFIFFFYPNAISCQLQTISTNKIYLIKKKPGHDTST